VAGQSLWGGLDTGGDTSRLCIVDDELGPLLDVTLNSSASAILTALAPYPRSSLVEIAAEASDCSIPLIRALSDAGYRAVMYDACQISRYLRMRRNKTDNNDARGIAELAKLQLPSMRAVYLKSPETQRLRAKLQFRNKLLGQRVLYENMVRSLLQLHGSKLTAGRSALTIERHVHEALEALWSSARIDLSDNVLPLLDLTMAVRRYVERIDAELLAFARAHPVCSRFMRIPGIGPVCAISFYTAVEDPFRFAHAAGVGPYLGLAPKVMQSGGTLRHGRISRRGNSLTRSHLVIAATVMMRDNMQVTPLKAWALGLAARAGRGKARVALARRLAVIMLAMWKNDTHFDEMLPSPKGSA